MIYRAIRVKHERILCGSAMNIGLDRFYAGYARVPCGFIDLLVLLKEVGE